MNAIVSGIIGNQMALTGTVRSFGDRLLVDFIVEAGAAHFRFGAGVGRFQTLDQCGQPIA
jgi:hypothetical protein